MKQPKFKVWVISSIAIFTIGIILIFIGSFQMVATGGETFTNVVSKWETENYTDEQILNDILSGFGMSESEIDSAIDDYNAQVDNTANLTEDQLETQIRNEIPTISTTTTITTKAELDAYLEVAVSYAIEHDYTNTASAQAEFIDELDTYISDSILIKNPTPSDLKVDEDMDEYFERTQLSNQDLEDYITSYFVQNV